MSGLVRGNRRKGVFALRGCFPAALAVGFHGSDGLWLHDFSRSGAIGTSLLSLAVI